MATLATAQAAQAVNLQKTYGAGQAAVRALADVSVTFERGRFTAVMGLSGSGKSTLMHCMAGLDRPTSGHAYVGGEDIGQFDDAGLLLALAVLIALIGIVNTLMLSVLERTREIGLLRAVGMRRPQVRAMIRSEAVILATFGALIGIVIGTLMGLALVSALRQQGITETSVPWVRLVEFLILAGVLGLVAASWPARRAASLDVLAAIAA
jgi:energy-coupling factor transporter ATP-binding protein EcfA2